MPFSDDEQILIEEKSKLKTVVLIVGVGLFMLSLCNFCLCTDNTCRTSIEALLVGWLAMFTGGAAVSWLANPFLIIAWILLWKNRKFAWTFSLLASVMSLIFLRFDQIIENESLHLKAITTIRPGYWLWLASCLTTFIGSLTIRIHKIPNHT